MLIIIGVILVLIIIAVNSVKSGYEFRDNSRKIHIGMTRQEVVSVMGNPFFVKNFPDGSCEYVYERREWKGVLRGGTQTRRMECIFDPNNILVSLGKNENCNRSGWW